MIRPLFIMRWDATDKFPDGSLYKNHGVHIIKMKCRHVIVFREMDVSAE